MGRSLRRKSRASHLCWPRITNHRRPDPWLDYANPWEIARPDVTVDVRFGGHAERLETGRGIWSGGQEVLAVAYDVPIPGYDTKNT